MPASAPASTQPGRHLATVRERDFNFIPFPNTLQVDARTLSCEPGALYAERRRAARDSNTDSPRGRQSFSHIDCIGLPSDSSPTQEPLELDPTQRQPM
jgi:hypothetical protein